MKKAFILLGMLACSFPMMAEQDLSFKNGNNKKAMRHLSGFKFRRDEAFQKKIAGIVKIAITAQDVLTAFEDEDVERSTALEMSQALAPHFQPLVDLLELAADVIEESLEIHELSFDDSMLNELLDAEDQDEMVTEVLSKEESAVRLLIEVRAIRRCLLANLSASAVEKIETILKQDNANFEMASYF